MKKPLLFLLFIILLIVVARFFLPEFFHIDDLDKVIELKNRWIERYANGSLALYLTYFFINVFVASVPIPGVSVVSLLGGLIFGLKMGFVLTSSATAIGNLFAFFLARYFLQDWVKKKYGREILLFSKNWQKDGALALFSARLFPLIPSFVANLIMGVSSLDWKIFFVVSWFGRLPMVLIYTWAGVEISKITKLSEILNYRIIVCLMVLAIVPWVIKFLFNKVIRT